MSVDKITSPIAKEGYPFILLFLGITAVTALIWGLGFPVTLPAAASVFTIYFFRNPARTVPVEEKAVISPADGRIIEVRKVREERILKADVLKISIFMSVFNVHVNRVPYCGKVKNIYYNKGKFLSAFKEKASLDNEQNAILLETEQGSNILFVQIAGLIARRIVCYLNSGDEVSKGDRFGLIRFGSRVDIYLPADTKINIQKGAKVQAGETILAYLE